MNTTTVPEVPPMESLTMRDLEPYTFHGAVVRLFFPACPRQKTSCWFAGIMKTINLENGDKRCCLYMSTYQKFSYNASSPPDGIEGSIFSPLTVRVNDLIIKGQPFILQNPQIKPIAETGENSLVIHFKSLSESDCVAVLSYRPTDWEKAKELFSLP